MKPKDSLLFAHRHANGPYPKSDESSPHSHILQDPSLQIQNEHTMFWILLTTNQLTHSMEQSVSSEANSHSVSQKIPTFYGTQKILYHVHNSQPLITVLSHMHPLHSFPSYFPKIHSNIISLPMPRSSEWFLPFRFSDQNFVCISHLSHVCYYVKSTKLPICKLDKREKNEHLIQSPSR